MPLNKKISVLEHARNMWFVLLILSGIIYWAARHDVAILQISENRTRIQIMESRIYTLESGLDKIRVQMDNIREDLSLIKAAVIR